jgi:UDP-N-acetylmuramoyl-L-alanyl-D-glutamate--2,6-diaminopimelate ligase
VQLPGESSGNMNDATTSSKTLQRLASVVNGVLSGDGDLVITDIVYDSRQVEPGALFVAMPGGYADGHEYIEQAVNRGAAAIMVQQPGDYAVPAIVVTDSRAALSPLAAEFFDHPSRTLKVVGVTGTDGKTSTSTLAEAMLSAGGYRTGLIGTVQIKIGDNVIDHETRQTTPESLDIHRMLRQMLNHGVDWVVLESTSHGLAMHRLDDVRFEVAAVTNITHEHLDFHGSLDAYWAAKRRLFELTGYGGRKAVVNLDDPGACTTLDVCEAFETITYSLVNRNARLHSTNVSLGAGGFSATFITPRGEFQVNSPLLGGFNVSNSLCAAGIALHAGLDENTIAATLANPPIIAGRMARIDEGQPFNVLVDYAHTPASLEKVLSMLRSLDGTRRIIVVAGSAGERDRAKRPLQGNVCARLADISIFTNEDPRYENARAIIDEIAEGARSAGGSDGKTLFTIEDRTEAIEHAVALAETGDTILLAGKGHERSIIVNGQKIPWDEAEVARTAIRKRIEREQNP